MHEHGREPDGRERPGRARGRTASTSFRRSSASSPCSARPAIAPSPRSSLATAITGTMRPAQAAGRHRHCTIADARADAGGGGARHVGATSHRPRADAQPAPTTRIRNTGQMLDPPGPARSERRAHERQADDAPLGLRAARRRSWRRHGRKTAYYFSARGRTTSTATARTRSGDYRGRQHGARARQAVRRAPGRANEDVMGTLVHE